MFKRTVLRHSMVLALALPPVVLAEVEVSGYLKNETAVFTREGQVTGEASSMLDDEGHDKGELAKFENSARIFLNGYIGEESSWHADINLIYDAEAATSDYKGHENYSQYDYLRELYVDTNAAGWDFRLGKQQVVWGTADGIKLLDIINPTDFRELNQAPQEDSRIPVWMINAERNVGENGNIQFIVSQFQENRIPGLNADGDSGHPFILKGVDTITGRVNGFLNVAPRLANVAFSFSDAAIAGIFTGDFNPLGLVPFTGLTVDGFASDDDIQAFVCPDGGCDGTQAAVSFGPGDVVLNDITQNGLEPGDPNGNNNVTNLMPITGPTPPEVDWRPSSASSAFEYMSNATFATFNTFAGNQQHSAATTQYVVDSPDDLHLNYGARFKSSTDGGLNFSFNYFYHYDANPSVDLSWHDAVTGQQLVTELRGQGTVLDPATGAVLADGPLVSPDDVPNDIAATGDNTTTVLLRNPVTNQYYGATDPDPLGSLGSTGLSPNGTELRFTEHYQRIHSIGGSFDTALDTAVPLVLRGELLYDKDVRVPVVDKRLLAIGDLEGALRTEKQDMFKYVLGGDITVWTNLLVSAQFIQFINLDFEDTERTCTTQTGIRFDCSRYTADQASLHLNNGLKQGEEYKEFYSLFFSKPFGDSQEHRWNNITIHEEGGGWWNRLDVEYTFTDTLFGSAEWNHYWGDEDTTFGQLAKSSSLQLGVKWIFE